MLLIPTENLLEKSEPDFHVSRKRPFSKITWDVLAFATDFLWLLHSYAPVWAWDASSAVAPYLWGPGHQNCSRFASSCQGTENYCRDGGDSVEESSLLSCDSCPQSPVHLPRDFVWQWHPQNQPFLVFCCVRNCDLKKKHNPKQMVVVWAVGFFAFFSCLSLPLPRKRIYFPLCECQVPRRPWQSVAALVLPEQQQHVFPGLSCWMFFEINRISVGEGSRDCWKGFQCAPTFVRSSAMWETDWDRCQASFMSPTKKASCNHKSVTSNLGRISASLSYSLFLVPQQLLTFSGSF